MRCWQCDSDNPLWRLKCGACRKTTAPREILIFVGAILFLPALTIIQLLATLVGLNDIRADQLPPIILVFFLLPLGVAAAIMSRQKFGWFLLCFVIGLAVLGFNVSLAVDLETAEALPAVTIWAMLIYAVIVPRWVSWQKGQRSLVITAAAVGVLELALNIGGMPVVGLFVRTVLANASLLLVPMAFAANTRNWFKVPDEAPASGPASG